MEHPQKNLLSDKSFVMKHMLTICRKVTLTFVKHVGRERRVVVPARRLVTPACASRHLPPDGRHVYRRAAVSLPPEGRHVYRRAAVSNASQEKSDEALGKSIATADRNEVVFPADTVFPRRPDKTHHYIPYYI